MDVSALDSSTKNAHYDIIEILLNKDVFVQQVTLVEQGLPTLLWESLGTPPVFCGGSVLLIFLVFCVWGVFVLCLVFQMLPLSLDLPFSIFSNVSSVRLYSYCFVGNSYFINDTCIYLHILMSSTIPCRMMFVSLKNNMTSVTSGVGIASPSCVHRRFLVGFVLFPIFSFLCSIL